MHHLAVDDGQYRANVHDLLVGDLGCVEVIVAQHCEVSPLALLDRSDLLFPLRSQEPSVVRRIEAQNLLAGDGLAGAPESGPR